MSRRLLADDLGAVVEPLIPPEPPKPQGGRPRVSDRAAPTGLLVVSRSKTPWGLLPAERGRGSGMTCRRRWRAWQRAGVGDRLQRVLLDRRGRRDATAFSRAALDGASIAANKGARRPGRTRRIAASRARSGTPSRMRTAPRSLPG